MLIILTAIFLHIVDDFYLQGILKDLKQKSWWDKQITALDENGVPHPNYNSDYIMGLLVHSFSWTFMVMLPILFASLNGMLGERFYLVAFIWNLGIHFRVDDLKANQFKLTLVQDQYIHIAQIIVTYLIFYALI